MSSLRPIVRLEEDMERVVDERFIERLEDVSTGLARAPVFAWSLRILRGGVDPAVAGSPDLDLALVEGREMFPGFGLEPELVAFDDESGRAIGHDFLRNLLHLVEGKPELCRLLLEERRLELRTFL